MDFKSKYFLSVICSLFKYLQPLIVKAFNAFCLNCELTFFQQIIVFIAESMRNMPGFCIIYESENAKRFDAN